MALTKGDEKKFVSILSDGSLRLPVVEGTEGAIKREYEMSDKTMGVKHELVFKSLSGVITDIAFFEGDFGKLIQVTFFDKEAEVEAQEFVLSIGTATNFGEDLLKKLPSVDLTKEVTLTPYSFEDDRGKTRRGVTLLQDGEKITNFFYDIEKKKNINKYPDPEGDTKTYDSDDWKMYFTKARKFLVKYAEDNLVKKEEVNS